MYVFLTSVARVQLSGPLKVQLFYFNNNCLTSFVLLVCTSSGFGSCPTGVASSTPIAG